ncbi:hypothetical protein FJT64_011856 [Amphibalanus amphitrite]|uniref:Uncharacterized protein n=1 Tax=Amphibalanus amphitrite TaxID=1232801 RepID=A0A6A4V5S7_AMPAM|nr:hypothetical protein FJT64_011856 [Amphibalanus amphitrite]
MHVFIKHSQLSTTQRSFYINYKPSWRPADFNFHHRTNPKHESGIQCNNYGRTVDACGDANYRCSIFTVKQHVDLNDARRTLNNYRCCNRRIHLNIYTECYHVDRFYNHYRDFNTINRINSIIPVLGCHFRHYSLRSILYNFYNCFTRQHSFSYIPG